MTFDVASEVYERHVGRYGPSLSAAHTAAAAVEPGQRVLDVGCGPGPLTQVLAGIVGEGSVAAVDPSPSFVDACRERLPEAEVRLGQAEELPFADGEFDIALSQLVVNFMADPQAGVRELRRVVRPGGTVSSCVWDYADGMEMLRAFWDAALELDPDAPDEGRVMRFCREGELAHLWESCGLTEVEDGELWAVADYESFDDYWEPFTSGLAPSGAYCASLDDDRREALYEACFRRLGSPPAPFTLRARAWYAVGRA
ncbi:MAG TPA: methyltransferase domain-containing protein [Gaiellaceae bacterium]|nr:methyltransferase domain-containing protein [Gaiellaceae bacterium]